MLLKLVSISLSVQTYHTCIQVLRFQEKSQDFSGIEPTPSQLQCDALPAELSSPWEQGGGE